MELKPQDLYVLLKLAVMRDQEWTFDSLGQQLGMSASQVHRSVKRAEDARLFSADRRAVNRRGLLEFIEHGVQYAFPAARGARRRGVATAYSARPMRDVIASGQADAQVVWADPKGDLMGEAIEPLHPRAPDGIRADEALYEVLALVDAMRLGPSTRERKVAVELLDERLR